MSPDKGTYNKEHAYVAFSRVTTLERLHIVNYTRDQIKVSDTAHEEMERLRSKSLPCNPVLVIHTVDHNKYISILHLNIAKL